MKGPASSILGAAVAVVIAVVVALAGASGGVTTGGVAVMLWVVALAFVVNWVGFVHSLLTRTERYYDLTGTATYLSVVVVALVLVGRYDARSLLLAGLVAVWTTRLGVFLFRRILRSGSDSRFEKILTDPARLFMTWTLQGLWVSLTLAAAVAAITAGTSTPLGIWWLVGTALWVAGFATESIADAQKSAFRSDAANEGRFISEGLWAWSRHPNYFGEIVLWVGVALVAVPALEGWQHVTLVSPVFVYVLLRHISGVPMLERKARKRWGDDPDWQRYTRTTPMLVPRPPDDGGGAGT